MIVGQEAIQEAEAEDGIVGIGQEVEVVPTTVTRVVGKLLVLGCVTKPVNKAQQSGALDSEQVGNVPSYACCSLKYLLEMCKLK